jgi:hypothetical protein
MKKRELAAAVRSLEGTVFVLILVVVIGPGHLAAMLDGITPHLMIAALLFVAGCLVFLAVAAPFVLARYVYRRIRQGLLGVYRRIQKWLRGTHIVIE